MMATVSNALFGEQSMVDFGQRLGEACRLGCESGIVVFLQGDLGMGKTTLSRGILKAFGHKGAVKSPTYTLVEPYEFNDCCVYHFDLYRLGDPQELEYMGIRDYFSGNSLCLVEWAQKGAGFLPAADIVVRIAPATDAKTVGRLVTVTAESAAGEVIVDALQQ